MSALPAVEPASLEVRAALALQLRTAHIRDVTLMRAFEQAPRDLFAPHRLRDLASRDISLPIGCGQIMPAPSDLARRLETLGVKPGHRVLEIGSGSGYSAAVLSRLAREVVSFERFETLAVSAAVRLTTLGVDNAKVIQGDGLAVAQDFGYFDRVVVHFCIDAPPEKLLARLNTGGAIGFGRFVELGLGMRPQSRWIKLERDANGALTETDVGLCRLGGAIDGPALVL